jgi:putative membrane protein
MPRYLLVASAIALLAACNRPDNTAVSQASDAAAMADSAAGAASAAASDANASAIAANSSVSAVSATLHTPSTPDFVNAAATTDMFEIQAAKIALRRSKNADVKGFAAMMIHDHTQSTAALKAAIQASGRALTPPADLPADMRMKLDDLNATPDAAFDKVYMDGQVMAHQTALSVMQAFAANGDTPQIKAFAAKVAPVVQQHLNHASTIRDSLQ